MNFLVRCGALSLLSQKSNGKVSLPPTLPKDAEFTLNPHREQAAPQQNAFDIAISPASEPPLSLRVFRNRLDVCTISISIRSHARPSAPRKRGTSGNHG